MTAVARSPAATALTPTLPLNLTSRAYAEHKFEYYSWILEHAPVTRGRISLLRVNLVTRYDDCRMVLTDSRFLRNRGRAKGNPKAGPAPIPLPKSIAALATSMIAQDDPEHRRLRNLVNKAFTPRAVAKLEHRVEEISHESLDGLEKHHGSGPFDLLSEYARPIPTRVISEMVGLDKSEIARFAGVLRVLSEGLSGWAIARTFLFDLPTSRRFLDGLIARKRAEPGDDILSQLIHAEEAGDRLSHDEVLAMVFLLVVAGFETTLHLISNGVHTLLAHPAELARLRAEPELWDSAVEELVRHRGPIQSTKPLYATEDVTLHGVTIARGSPTFPMLGAANHDPRVFADPDRFDVARAPNRHLGFGFGAHFCLGAQLARMETRVALRNLLERSPDLRIAVPESELTVRRLPGWHGYERLPVALR